MSSKFEFLAVGLQDHCGDTVLLHRSLQEVLSISGRAGMEHKVNVEVAEGDRQDGVVVPSSQAVTLSSFMVPVVFDKGKECHKSSTLLKGGKYRPVKLYL